MPEPWHVLQRASTCLRTGGILLPFLPTIIQVTDLVNALKQEDHFEPLAQLRPWRGPGKSVADPSAHRIEWLGTQVL